jgi:eukaryotic-like serine/threonine-protein kinase
MTPERWRQVTPVYGAVMTKPPSARVDALKELCPDGRMLLFREASTDQGRHLMKRSLPPDEGSVTEVVQTSERMRNGELSPDGRWLAFESDTSGTWEVYARSVREGDTTQRTVSAGGGRQPHWSNKGKELFFFGADGALMKVDVSGQSEWRASTPVRVVAAGYYSGSVVGRFDGRQYDVAADGQRFLMIKPQSETTQPSIVIEHFDEELKARVPSK